MKKHYFKETRWYVYYDRSLEGNLNWVICHDNLRQLDDYLDTGEDQLWNTKGEAFEMIEQHIDLALWEKKVQSQNFKEVDAFTIVNCWNGGRSQEVIRDGKTYDEVKAEYDGFLVYGPYKKEIYVNEIFAK